MKIGILTHCIANNFGANLQALSTAMYLKHRGFTPFFFFWDDYLKERSTKLNSEQLHIHRTFLTRNGFEVSEPCSSDDDFVRTIKNNNINNILVGSDAVLTISSWIDKIVVGKKGIRIVKTQDDKKFPNPFWIPFADQVPQCRFYYISPSCQSTNFKFLSVSLLKKMKTQMSKFDFLCARDTCTQQMMEYILGNTVNVPITPDPVWGFSKNVTDIPSKETIISKFKIKEDYFLTSFYKTTSSTVKWLDTLRDYTNKDNCELYSLPMPQGHFNSNLPKIELPLDSIDWFALIKYSKGYIGNNMHPVIVAIHNHVPFYSIDQHGKKILCFRLEKSSKVYDLLNRFDLLDYRIKSRLLESVSPNDVYAKLTNFPINTEEDISFKMEKDYLAMMDSICNMFK